MLYVCNLLEECTLLQGSAVPLCQEQLAANHSFVTEVTQEQQTQITTMPMHPPTSIMSMPGKASTLAASVAPYTKCKSMAALPRRAAAAYGSPTYLIKHGNKLQRLMIPGKPLTSAPQFAYSLRSPDQGSGDATEGLTRHTIITPPPEMKHIL